MTVYLFIYLFICIIYNILVLSIKTHNGKKLMLMKNQISRLPRNKVENVELIHLFLKNLIGIILNFSY